MFGYIAVNKPELKIKDFEKYNSYYCGLCHALDRSYGKFGKLTLSYDMTFLSMLLSSLYEPEETSEKFICPLHMGEKKVRTSQKFDEYASDMNILLSYFNLMDDWYDDKNPKSKVLAKMLSKFIPDLIKKYPRQYKAIKIYINKLHAYEDKNVRDIDKASGLTGNMLAEIFAPFEDEWMPSLRRIGFYLGKFIYLMDAYEDRDEDAKSKSYNIWLLQEKITDEEIIKILNLMMSEATLTFEALPIIKNAEILRNILYSGVWMKCPKQTTKENK